MKIVQFGGFDPEYARNRVLRIGLERLGVEVEIVAVPPRSLPVRRAAELVARFALRGGGADALLVPEFAHKDVPLARLLSCLAGRPLVVDPLVSRWDTKVGDWQSVAPGSLQADHNARLDRAAMRFADLLLCDTAAHARYYQERYRVPPERCAVVPVGFDDGVFQPAAEPPPEPFRVAFFGSFLPLHGVDTIVAAAERLQADGVRFLLVGGGQTFDRVAAARARGVDLEVVPALPPADLAARLRSAHVLLGIFGTTPKARRVVPHKVYQGLALGRALVTADTPALREFFLPGEHLLAVPHGDDAALAAAIRRLRDDPSLRRRLAAAGARMVHTSFRPEDIARRLLAAGRSILDWPLEVR